MKYVTGAAPSAAPQESIPNAEQGIMRKQAGDYKPFLRLISVNKAFI
jgi:hypothetical protein